MVLTPKAYLNVNYSSGEEQYDAGGESVESSPEVLFYYCAEGEGVDMCSDV